MMAGSLCSSEFLPFTSSGSLLRYFLFDDLMLSLARKMISVALVGTAHSHGLKSSGLKIKPQGDMYPPGVHLHLLMVPSAHQHSLTMLLSV